MALNCLKNFLRWPNAFIQVPADSGQDCHDTRRGSVDSG